MIDPTKNFIRIAITDDHAIVREGYRRLLERCLDFRLVGEAKDADEIFKLSDETKIDVVLVDISLPGLSGIEITRRLKTRHPDMAILISSMHDEAIFAKHALEAGALGYITKSSEPDILIQAIRKVAAGHRYLSPDVATKIALHDSHAGVSHELSQKEFEILRRIVSGDSIDTIAQSMSLSPKTIANYQSSIKQKLNVESSAQLFRAAARLGLVPESE